MANHAPAAEIRLNRALFQLGMVCLRGDADRAASRMEPDMQTPVPCAPIVRAIDVGYGNTKYTLGGARGNIRCAHFPSQAHPGLLDQTRDPLAGPRKTVAIPLNGLFYEVGPEISLAGHAFRGSHGHDRFIDTPEYLALLRAALRYMKVDEIDLLVVGLPVALFASKRGALEKLAAGRHEVAAGRFVTVRKALAVAQPQGALVQFAAQTQNLTQLSKQLNLVVDPGYRTFDWLVAAGMKLLPAKSHSINRGILDVIKTMCRRVSADRGLDYRDVDSLEAAMRSGGLLMVGGEPYDLKRLMPITTATARQAVSTMTEWLGETREFDNIVLVGGGASLFGAALKEAFPKHKVHQVRDPLYANVTGFHLAGLDYLAAQMPAPQMAADSIHAKGGEPIDSDMLPPEISPPDSSATQASRWMEPGTSASQVEHRDGQA